MKFVLLLAIACTASIAFSQSKMGTPPLKYGNYYSSIGVFGGVYQGNTTFGEVGMGVAELDELENLDFKGAGLSLEFNTGNKVYGVKLDAWHSLPLFPLSLGLGTVSYVQEDRFNQTIRPTVGLSYNYFRFSYGYDILLGRQNVQYLNRHQLFVRYYLPIKKKEGFQGYFSGQE